MMNGVFARGVLLSSLLLLCMVAPSAQDIVGSELAYVFLWNIKICVYFVLWSGCLFVCLSVYLFVGFLFVYLFTSFFLFVVCSSLLWLLLVEVGFCLFVCLFVFCLFVCLFWVFLFVCLFVCFWWVFCFVLFGFFLVLPDLFCLGFVVVAINLQFNDR